MQFLVSDYILEISFAKLLVGLRLVCCTKMIWLSKDLSTWNIAPKHRKISYEIDWVTVDEKNRHYFVKDTYGYWISWTSSDNTSTIADMYATFRGVFIIFIPQQLECTAMNYNRPSYLQVYHADFREKSLSIYSSWISIYSLSCSHYRSCFPLMFRLFADNYTKKH